MKKLTIEEVRAMHWIGTCDGEEWGYPEIEVVETYRDKNDEELLIDAETLEVLRTISDEDYEPNILIVE